MLKVIEEELCNLMNEEKTIYILKGFDSIINNIELKYDHIFDLGICDNLMNIFNVDDNSFMICNLEKLKLNNIYWCLYEELIYTEKKSLYGLISASGYQIRIIDIGCFDYYYPGIQGKNINETIKKFEEETPESNMLQRIYTSMENRSGNLVISYNMFENEKTEMQVKLIRRYSEYFDNKPKEVIKETKL